MEIAILSTAGPVYFFDKSKLSNFKLMQDTMLPQFMKMKSHYVGYPYSGPIFTKW